MGIPSRIEAIVPEIYDLWDRGEMGDNYFTRNIIFLWCAIRMFVTYFCSLIFFQRFRWSRKRNDRTKFRSSKISKDQIKFLSFTKWKAKSSKRLFYYANVREGNKIFIRKLILHFHRISIIHSFIHSLASNRELANFTGIIIEQFSNSIFDEKTKSPMKNFLPYFPPLFLHFHDKLFPFVWYAPYFQPIDKRSNFISLASLFLLSLRDQRIFRNAISFDFQIWNFSKRRGEGTERSARVGRVATKSSSKFNRSPVSAAFYGLYKCFVRAKTILSFDVWRGENSKPGQFRNAFNEAGHF